MAKFYGKVGFAVTSETSPGVWTDEITERYYYGDINRNRRRWAAGSGVNDNLLITNEISIVADPFASNNLANIRYVGYMGALWKIESAEVEYPRIKLTVGGVYNGDTP